MQNPTSFYNFYTQQKILLPKNILTGNHLLSQMNTNQSAKLSLAFCLPYNKRKYKKLPNPHILRIARHKNQPNRETLRIWKKQHRLLSGDKWSLYPEIAHENVLRMEWQMQNDRTCCHNWYTSTPNRIKWSLITDQFD